MRGGYEPRTRGAGMGMNPLRKRGSYPPRLDGIPSFQGIHPNHLGMRVVRAREKERSKVPVLWIK
jgi:hypothetical protein